MKAINIVLDIVPVQQTGSNCKTIAITALDQYYADKLGYPSIPLHKRYQGVGLLSTRQIAKKLGSLQGELLEVGLIEDILTDMGYEAEIVDCKTIDFFREQIIDSLEKDNPLITFFAVSADYHTLGLPTRFYNGLNEHDAVIMGFDSKTDQVTMMHWGQYYTCPLKDLFKSTNSLPEQRDQELYKPAKFEDPMRKYQILTDEEAKVALESTLKKSIVPKAGTGFKNKLIKLKKFPEAKEISAHRKEYLIKQINLNYIVTRIVKLSPYDKQSVAEEEGANYKKSITQALENFLKNPDEDALSDCLRNSGQTYLNRIFAEGNNVSRHEIIQNLLQQFSQNILKVCKTTASDNQQESPEDNKATAGEHKQDSELDLYIIEHVTKKLQEASSDGYVSDEEDEFWENVLRIVPAARDEKLSKFKKIDVAKVYLTILSFTRRPISAIRFIFDRIDQNTILNDEKIKSVISQINEKSIPYSFENMSEEAIAQINMLINTVEKNSAIFQEKFDAIVKNYQLASGLLELKTDKAAQKIIRLYKKSAVLHKWDMQKLENLLIEFSAQLHRTLPPDLRTHHKVEVPVNLMQGNIIIILEGFKERLAQDEKYPIPAIRQSILDSLTIDTGGHCRAISGYRSYYIALEKQNNPDTSLEQIIKKVEAKEIAILQAMDDYRHERTITREQHEEINSYIFAVATTQQNSINFLNGDVSPIACRHHETITDSQNRYMELIKPKSSEKIASDIKSIIIELMEKKEDGNFIIYNSFNQHQTFFMLSKIGDSVEVIFSDPNLPTYITHNLSHKNWLDQLITQVDTAHPKQNNQGF